MDSNDKKPIAPKEDNISDSRDNCISETSSTTPGNFKLIFCLLFSSCCVLVLALALWPYNSNCRIQILTHTIKMLSLLSLCLTQFLFQFSFFLPASIILPASFPFYLLLFFFIYSHFSILLYSLCPISHTHIHTLLSGHSPSQGLAVF